MKRTALALCLFIILIAPITLLAQSNSVANAVTVPEFTLKIVDYVVGGGLEIAIQNQYVISNGHDYPWIFYDFRYKWHESANWYHPEPDPTKRGQYIAEIGTTGVTRRVVPLNRYYEILGSSNSHLLDMQIRSINGYSNFTASVVPPLGINPNDYPVIAVNTSDWSNTQTITIDANGSTSTPNTSPPQNSTSTPEPQEQEQPQPEPFPTTLVVVASVVSVVLVGIGLLVYFRKRKH